MSALIALLLSSPAAVPPPMPQQHAECTAPTYASDMLVCSNPMLLEMDGKLALLAAEPIPPEFAIEDQWDWFRRRSACAATSEHLACLSAAYAERIAILSAARRHPPASLSFSPYTCGKEDVGIADAGGGVVALKRGQRIELGLAAGDVQTWKPFLQMKTDKDSIAVSWNVGRLNCKRTR